MNQQTFEALLTYWLIPSFGVSIALCFAGFSVAKWLGYVLASLCLFVCALAALFGVVFSGRHESVLAIVAIMFGPGVAGVALGTFLGRKQQRY